MERLVKAYRQKLESIESASRQTRRKPRKKAVDKSSKPVVQKKQGSLADFLGFDL